MKNKKDEVLEMLEKLCYTFMPEDHWAGVPLYEKAMEVINSRKEELDQALKEKNHG